MTSKRCPTRIYDWDLRCHIICCFIILRIFPSFTFHFFSSSKIRKTQLVRYVPFSTISVCFTGAHRSSLTFCHICQPSVPPFLALLFRIRASQARCINKTNITTTAIFSCGSSSYKMNFPLEKINYTDICHYS